MLNENLNQLAIEVLANYQLIPDNIQVIQGDSIKTVWKIKVQDNLYCLKRLKQSIDKALFSVNAQIFIDKAGGNVAGVLLNKEEQPVTQYNEQLFVLYQWLEGKDLNFGNNKDLEQAVKGLAKFHNASCGYNPPESARISSKEGKWPEQYTSMINKFKEWKESANENPSKESNNSFLFYVDSMIEIGNKAVALLQNSEYSNIISKPQNLVLCHQDYGRGNAILTDKGVFVLDLDGVTFDLPIRDLRKIIGKQAENRGTWDINFIETVFNWYTQIRSLSGYEKEILYIDLLFPHWFYGLVKNIFKKNQTIKKSQVEKISRLEQSKWALIKKR